MVSGAASKIAGNSTQGSGAAVSLIYAGNWSREVVSWDVPDVLERQSMGYGAAVAGWRPGGPNEHSSMREQDSCYREKARRRVCASMVKAAVAPQVPHRGQCGSVRSSHVPWSGPGTSVQLGCAVTGPNYLLRAPEEMSQIPKDWRETLYNAWMP
jgi:hypothetical protein